MIVRPLIVVAVLAGCTHQYEPPVPADAPTGNFRVATFNVRRFFDTACASGACGGGEFEELPSTTAFEQRATQIADAIRALDADVVSLQELETQPCLDELLARLAGMHGVLGEIGTTASVDVAVISRTPIELVATHRANEVLSLPDGSVTQFSRELLEVHVRSSGGVPVVTFAAHFKSKANDEPARRLAEARHTRRIVDELAVREPASVIVLAGDLNDTPGSPPLEALTADGGLVRAAADLSEPAQATYIFDGRGQAIDHLLIAPGGDALRVPRSSRVWRDGTGWGGSDHAALTTDFALP
jgi:predicted extracellular nuclease